MLFATSQDMSPLFSQKKKMARQKTNNENSWFIVLKKLVHSNEKLKFLSSIDKKLKIYIFIIGQVYRKKES